MHLETCIWFLNSRNYYLNFSLLKLPRQYERPLNGVGSRDPWIPSHSRIIAELWSWNGKLQGWLSISLKSVKECGGQITQKSPVQASEPCSSTTCAPPLKSVFHIHDTVLSLTPQCVQCRLQWPRETGWPFLPPENSYHHIGQRSKKPWVTINVNLQQTISTVDQIGFVRYWGFFYCMCFLEIPGVPVANNNIH